VAGGVRVVIDLGMQELMNGAELKSLTTQLMCSYGTVLSLTCDAVLQRTAAASDAAEEAAAEVAAEVAEAAEEVSMASLSIVEAGEGGEGGQGGEGRGGVGVGNSSRGSGDDGGSGSELGAAGLGEPVLGGPGLGATGVRERSNTAALEALRLAEDIKPFRLMFSSLTGKVADALARDDGSARWPVGLGTS